MRNLLFISLLSFALASCTNHGKKIEVEGTKTEVFYKGDGVTEADAKKVGDLLKARFIQSKDKKGSIQVTHENDTYTLRFVYDKEIYKTLKDVDNEFKALAIAASKDVFNGKKINIALADDQFKDWKTIAWDADFAKAMDDAGDDGYAANKDNFEHESVGDIDFYWAKDFPDEESKRIADYIIQQGAFSGGTAQIIMTSLNGRTLLRFPVKPEAVGDAELMSTMGTVAQDLKDKLFPSTPFTFQATDEKMKVVKSWDF